MIKTIPSLGIRSEIVPILGTLFFDEIAVMPLQKWKKSLYDSRVFNKKDFINIRKPGSIPSKVGVCHR